MAEGEALERPVREKADGPGRGGAEAADKKTDEGKGNGGKEAPKPPIARWPWIAGGLFVLGFVAVVLYLVFAPKPDVWTNDAYVRVHYATIAPRVSGQVATVQVDDNQIVKAGQVLATLDPRDYQTSVAMAEAALARDTAQVANASANVARQGPVIEQQEAAVASAQAKFDFSQADARRYGNLAATGAGTTQQREQTASTLRMDESALQTAQAALEASRRQLEVLKAQKSAADGTIKADEAQLEQARLNLGYTTIVAPLDGMVGQRSVQVGQYVGPQSVLMAIVPLDQLYVLANYREVDLRHVRAGQRATVYVDAYNIALEGVVDSLAPASGASFSPIPPNNATGNFTKIVQRLPIKITIKPGQPLADLLLVGFSVEATIHTALEDVVGEQRRAAAPASGR